MTDVPPASGASPEPIEPPPEPASPVPASTTAVAPAPAWLIPRAVALTFVLAALAALALSGMLWQKLANIQEQLAHQSSDTATQAVEARALARQAEDVSRDTATRLTVAESRLSEAVLQRTQLDELMKSLSRSRDENLVVDIESALQLAQQQAQLTGSIEPLLAALKSADQRLTRAAQPRLAPLQRAIAHDVDRIKAATVADTPSLLLKLDELVRLADEVPVANSVGPERSASVAKPSDAKPANKTWWERDLAQALDEIRRLVRVSRIEQPEASLLSPEQAFFVRENLKLKLLNARLGLLARQTDSARSDMAASDQMLGKYFDAASRKTQTMLQLLHQVQGQMKNLELPRMDASLTALATAAAGR